MKRTSQVHELTRDNIMVIEHCLRRENETLRTQLVGMREHNAEPEWITGYENQIARLIDTAEALGIDLPTGT